MAGEQICEPCSTPDLSVHPHTDKQTRMVIKEGSDPLARLRGCTRATLPPPVLPMPAATLRRTCGLQNISSVKCMIAERTVNSFPFKPL